MTTAPPARGLLDTSVVVDYREGWPDPILFFVAIRAVRLPEFSQITAMTLLAGCLNAADVMSERVFLQISTVHTITVKIVRRAQSILESLAPPCGLTADDSIIAATAIEHSLPLYTLDPARFTAVPGLTTIRPY